MFHSSWLKLPNLSQQWNWRLFFPNCFMEIISLTLGKWTSRNYFCIQHLEEWPIGLQHRVFPFHDLIELTCADVHTHAHFCLALDASCYHKHESCGHFAGKDSGKISSSRVVENWVWVSTILCTRCSIWINSLAFLSLSFLTIISKPRVVWGIKWNNAYNVIKNIILSILSKMFSTLFVSFSFHSCLPCSLSLLFLIPHHRIDLFFTYCDPRRSGAMSLSLDTHLDWYGNFCMTLEIYL